MLMFKVAMTYVNVWRLGADVYVNDPVVMKEWYKFTMKYPTQVRVAIS